MLIGSAVSALLIASGCSNKIEQAGTKLGTIAAGVSIPELPAECRKREPHADPALGSEPLSILKRERAHLDSANKRVEMCAENYDTVRAGLMGPR